MSGVPCFWLEPVKGYERLWLRRYGGACRVGKPFTCHNAKTLVAPVIAETEVPKLEDLDPADARWPARCEQCNEPMDGTHRQVFQHQLYRRSDTGAETTLDEAPPGAMWDATWFDHPDYKGPDGRCLVVRCPDGHDWMIDGRASNCALPSDHVHKCWVRHGEPPLLTVDKAGVTCAAGAGSIATGTYHGFLRNGILVPC